jgi:SAM-dependent methyltransferase
MRLGNEREPHRARHVAESFGSDPELYDRARPTYPDALVKAVVAVSPGRDVLDVGCGTGIAARQFQAAGCRVLGVDVDERMAAFAQKGGLTVEVAPFESWDANGRTFDAVIAGQTWHWIDPVAGPAKASEVLRPKGRLALFWNVADPEPEIATSFSAVYRELMSDWDPWARPPLDAYSHILANLAEGIRTAGAFHEPEQWRFDWERSYTPREWLDTVASGGDTSRFSPGELEQVLAGIGATIESLGGNLTMRYATVVLTAARNA